MSKIVSFILGVVVVAAIVAIGYLAYIWVI